MTANRQPIWLKSAKSGLSPKFSKAATDRFSMYADELYSIVQFFCEMITPLRFLRLLALNRTVVMVFSLCATLSGCTVQSLKTSGEVAQEKRVAAVEVVLDPSLPNNVRITRHHSGDVTESDKFTARTNAAKLVRLFSNGFANSFPATAAGYGLAVAKPPADAVKLKVAIASLMTDCSGFGCQSTLIVKVELLNESAAPFWKFSSKVGQSIINAPISDDLFNTFATALLDSMKRDNVIAIRQLGAN